MGLGPLNPEFNSDLSALIAFYSAFPRCTTPIGAYVKPPYGYVNGFKPLEELQDGRISFTFSYVPDHPKNARMYRDRSKEWETMLNET